MECPKCGYDRQSEDTHCALCGVDFGLLDRQAVEKKQLKAKKQPQPPGAAAGPGLVMEVTEPEKIEEILPVDRDCPKCDAPRNTGDLECPQCGVIYEKHEQMLAQKKAEEEALKIAEEQRFLEEKARIQKEAEEGIRKAKAKREAAAKKQALTEKKADEKKAASEAGPEVKVSFSVKNNKIINFINTNRRKITIASIIMVAVIATGWGSFLLVTEWRETVRKERLLADQQAEQKRLQEEQQKTIQRFYSNKEERIQYFKSLITQRKFDKYASEIKKYNIPQLKAELEGVKTYLKEIKLFDSAKWIPAAEVQENYDVYFKLNQLNSKNKVYAKKLKKYRKKLAQQNFKKASHYLTKKKRVRADLSEAIAAIDRAIQLEGAKKKYNRIWYKLKNAELLFYEGNDKLQMAVRNDGLTKGATGGQRKLYVWLKNVGETPYFINVDYFTLVGKNKKRYSYNNCSRELIVNLQPGQETGGFLYFYTASRPAVLVFNHINAGKISRKFP